MRQRTYQQTRVYPYPLGAGSARPKSKNERSRPRKPLISSVFCAQRGIETMVSEGARPWGRGKSGDCELKQLDIASIHFKGKVCNPPDSLQSPKSGKPEIPFSECNPEKRALLFLRSDLALENPFNPCLGTHSNGHFRAINSTLL